LEVAVNRYPIEIGLFRGWRPGPLTIYPEWEPIPFTIRTISRQEFRNWQRRFPDRFDFEDQVLAAGVLEHPAEWCGQPWTWDLLPGGLPEQVVQEVLYYSGFSDRGPHPLVMAETQSYLERDEAKYDLLIKMAFDTYRLSDLMDMETAEYNHLLGLAQWKLHLIGFDTDIVLDPEAHALRMKTAHQQAALAEMQAQANANLQIKNGPRHGVVKAAETTFQAGGEMDAGFLRALRNDE
jgi:hypothetical protein